MRVLFADSVGESTITQLEERGHTCVVEAGLHAGDLASHVDRVRRAGGAQHQGRA